MQFKLAHLVQKPAREYVPACEPRAVDRTIREAKKKSPLVGGPVVTRLPPFDLNHPLHPRWASRERPQPVPQPAP